MTESNIPRPGVMIYFDLAPALEKLSDADRGRLLSAILDYAQFGEEPILIGTPDVIWSLIKPRIDADGERYEEVRRQRQYAVFKREYAKKYPGAEAPDFEEWKAERLSPVIGRYP